MQRLKNMIAGILIITWISVSLGGMAWADETSTASRPNPRHPWPALIQQADMLGLPTEFLTHIDPAFVNITFEDLRT